MGTDAAGARVIDRKYRLLSELGSGAMGVVYLAEQLDPDGQPQRQVALKMLRAELSADPDFTRRFLREVRVAMQLQSPHTITVHDSGRDEGGRLYYTMELARGPTLREVLRAEGALPVARAVRILAQICEALAEAHGLSEPVVHRDLKPANVVVEEREGLDWVRLADFGIAKIVGEQSAALTRAGESLGTPLYMAPEQWRGDDVDARTDLYALGVLAYQMLAGRTPFVAGPSLEALSYQHLHKPPPPLPGAIPAPVRSVVERLLAKEPAARPPDAASVRRALAAALDGASEPGPASETVATQTIDSTRPALPERPSLPPATRAIGPAERPRRPWSRPLALAAAAVVVVAATLGAPRLAAKLRGAPAGGVIASAPATGNGRAAPGQSAAEMLEVAGGEFFLGCNEAVDTGCYDDEKPGRLVRGEAFRIDRLEVTVDDYRTCVEAGACSRDSFTVSPRCNWAKESLGRHPINCVNWEQARAYCAWAGKRLPTDAEWEQAARGTDGRVYPWGNDWDPGRANADRHDDGFTETAPVGSFPAGASPLGALDMSGNVFEWTDGWYDPQQRTRSLRGGSWNYEARDLRASNRYGDAPQSHRPDVGFRCAQ